MNKMRIQGPRQKRAIETLLSGPVTVKNIGTLIGALNPRQVIFELRNQGFDDAILTRRFDIIDQDGKRCRPGEYFIPEDAKPVVRSVLKAYIDQTSHKRHDVTENNDKTHDNKEVQ